MTERKKKRKAHMRAIVFKLDCGHKEEVATRFYRLPAIRIERILGSYMRDEGIFCMKCRAIRSPVESLGTRRWD